MPSRLIPDLNEYLVGSTARPDSGISAEEHAEIDAYIQSMHQGGVSIDEISQATNIPPTKVVESLNRQPKGRATISEVGDTPRPAPLDIPAATGIESVVTDDDRTDMGQLVDQGFSVTDIASDMLASMDPDPMATIDPSHYGQELLIAETMEELGTELSEADTEALDNTESGDTRTATEVKLASVAGAAALLENDPTDLDARETLDAEAQMLQILSGSGLKDNEKLATQLEMYKNAGELFFNTDDLADFIPKPDQALPFLVAGASLIQSGEKGESWGSALAKALSTYSLTGYKERTAYQNKLLDLKLKEKQAIQGFVSQMYMADRANQLSLANTLFNADRQLYEIEVDGVIQDRPEGLTDYQIGRLNNSSNINVLRKWPAEQTLKNYTLIDSRGNMIMQALTDTAAQRMISEGTYEDVQVGDQRGGLKLYNVDGVNEMHRPADIAQLRKDGKKVFTATGNDLIEAYDPQTKQNIFTTEEVIRAQANLGVGGVVAQTEQNQLSPIDGTIAYAIDDNGNPMLGNPNMILGLSGQNQIAALLSRVQDQFANGRGNRDQILRGIDYLRDVAREGLYLGTTGTGVDVISRAINEFNQVGELFQREGWNFEIGEGENKTVNNSYEDFKAAANLEEWADSEGGQFFIDAGIDRSLAQNLMFQLALSSAMLEGQKGRDISDRDIQFHMARTGANATSLVELDSILDHLERSTIDYLDRMTSNTIFMDRTRIPNPDGSGDTIKLLEYEWGDFKEEDDLTFPTPGLASIADRRTRLQNIEPRAPLAREDATGPTPLLEGGSAPAGIGTQSIHDIWLEADAAAARAGPTDKRGAVLAFLERKRAEVRDLAGGNDALYNETWAPISDYMLKQMEQAGY